jgi:hypothetical protein
VKEYMMLARDYVYVHGGREKERDRSEETGVKGRHKPHARRDLVDEEGVDVEDLGIVTGYCGKLCEMVEAQTPCSPGRGGQRECRARARVRS